MSCCKMLHHPVTPGGKARESGVRIPGARACGICLGRAGIIPRMKPHARWASAAISCLALLACSPTLDWREVRPAGTRLQVMFPCKVVIQERRVQLAGQAVDLSLRACSADNATWGLAHADVIDPRQLRAAMNELLAAAVRNIGAASPQIRPLQVPGATPHEASVHARLSGRRPDGKAVEMAIALFADGTRVFQATWLAAGATGDGAASFFASLRISP